MENNYRITVEPLTEEGKREFPGKLRSFECEGFTIITRGEGVNMVCIQSMNKTENAAAIFQDKSLFASSKIAEGMYKAEKIECESVSMLDILKKALG